MSDVDRISKQIIDCFKKGNKLLICGNGGSSCMASHFAGELVGKFKKERKALPAIAFNDVGMITAIANDYGYDFVFERMLEAYAKKGDILITLSTSGISRNIIVACVTAKRLGVKIIKFPNITELQKEVSTFKWNTASVQEEHLGMIHDICEKVEEVFV